MYLSFCEGDFKLKKIIKGTNKNAYTAIFQVFQSHMIALGDRWVIIQFSPPVCRYLKKLN